MNIQKYLIFSMEKYGSNNCLHTNKTYYTYKDLYKESQNISNIILNIEYKKHPVIVMGTKSFYTHSAICGIIISGSYYTPLNQTFPKERNISIINNSQSKIIYLDYTDFENYEEILKSIDNYNIICPNEHIKYLSDTFPNHTFKSESEVMDIINVEDNNTCYMLFTSGSTGQPKGIQLSHYNLYSYITAFNKRNNVTSSARLMQMNDLTFDLSIHSIFLSFLSGGCLYIPEVGNKLNPIGFINEHSINHILMVPSSLTLMAKLRLLKENSMPSLKYVSFCGEALPFNKAILMAKACPNAKLENLYGPTEATIACTYFEFNKDIVELEEYCGSMPIGCAYDGMEAFIVDDNNNVINDERTGQLVLSGNQLAKGYINNMEQTKSKFIKINNKDCYLTGDLCRYVNNQLVFLGRNDSQVQIRGYRVELYEVENAVSKIQGILSNACIPIPVSSQTYEDITLFITADKTYKLDEITIKENLSKMIPNYMIPKNIIVLDNMPLNSNGKIDRNKLKEMV